MPPLEEYRSAARVELDTEALPYCGQIVGIDRIRPLQLRIVSGTGAEHGAQIVEVCDAEHCFKNRTAVIRIDGLKKKAMHLARP
jgi:hypothetical protein